MPKLKPTQTQEMTQCITNNVRSRACALGIESNNDIAEKIFMRPSTFRERKRNPLGWRIDELARAAIALKCTLSWLVTDHTKIQ